MAHPIKDWRDQPDHTTPINAASLEDLEDRAMSYADAVGVAMGSRFRGVWSSGTTYALNDGVSRGTTIYISTVGSNLNNDPATDTGTHWATLVPSSMVSGGSLGAPTSSSVGILPFPTGVAATDVANINAVLARSGTIRPNPLIVTPVYATNAPLVLYPNSDVDFGASIFNLAASSFTNMLNNRALTANRTATDGVTTAGSAVLASATLAATAVAGNMIAVNAAGVGSSQPGAWYGVVQSVVGSNITLSTLASQTIASGATASLYTIRDTNITIRGGVWNAGSNQSVGGVNQHVIRLRRIDNLTIRDVIITGTGMSGGAGGFYGIHPGDVTNLTVENVRFSGNGDGVHITGPISNATIRGVYGFTNDDMVAIDTNDGQIGDVEGTVASVRVYDLEPTNAWTALKLQGGVGSASYKITDFSAKGIKGTTQQSAVNIVNYQGNLQENVVDIEDVSTIIGAGFPLINIVANNAKEITLKDITWNELAPVPSVGVIATQTGIQVLNIENLNIRGALTGITYGVAVGTTDGVLTSQIGLLRINGLSIPDSPADHRAISLFNTASSIGQLIVNDAYVPGTGTTLIRNNGPGVITSAHLRGGYMPGSVVYRSDNAGTNAATMKLSDWTCNNSFAFLVKHPFTLFVSNSAFPASAEVVSVQTASATPIVINWSNSTFGSGPIFIKDATQTVTVTGTPSLQSGVATLVAGTSGSIAATSITANGRIRLTHVSTGGTLGILSATIVAGTGFTINSTSGTDTSKVFWEIVQY